MPCTRTPRVNHSSTPLCIPGTNTITYYRKCRIRVRLANTTDMNHTYQWIWSEAIGKHHALSVSIKCVIILGDLCRGLNSNSRLVKWLLTPTEMAVPLGWVLLTSHTLDSPSHTICIGTTKPLGPTAIHYGGPEGNPLWTSPPCLKNVVCKQMW